MYSERQIEGQRALLLIKLDGENLFNRIKFRKVEYLGMFAMKRTRDHFSEVFRNRYSDVTISELTHCGEESLIAINQFYTAADNIYWYLRTTEDMPNMIDDQLDREIVMLEELSDTMHLYIAGELGYQDDTAKIEETDLNLLEDLGINDSSEEELCFDESSEDELPII